MPRDPVSYHEDPIWRRLSISFMGAACVIFLFFIFYKILRNHCLAFHGYPLFFRLRNQRLLRNENNPEDPLQSGGLASDVVQSLPLVQFREEIKEGDDGHSSSDCAICLGEFGKVEWLRQLPNCSHFFHVHCIDIWFRSHSNCPLCRKKVLCEFSDSWSTTSMITSLETLRREEIHRERPLDYRLRESEAMRNRELRQEATRGIQTLMWL